MIHFVFNRRLNEISDSLVDAIALEKHVRRRLSYFAAQEAQRLVDLQWKGLEKFELWC